MANLIPMPMMQFFDNNGDPLAGGKLYSYQAGTINTPLATYTDNTAGTPNANPVILDSSGRSNIWFSASDYKLVLTDSSGSVIWTVDHVNGANSATLSALSASSGSTLVGHLSGATGAVQSTVYDELEWGSVSIFKFMTEVQRNDVMGLVGSTNVSAAVQKAFDHAAITQRPVVGWGRVRLENKINPYSSFWGIGGGQFQGAGLRFVWTGSDDKVFEFLGEDVQGWSFRNFRIDCQFVTSPAIMMWFEQGNHGCIIDEFSFRGYHTGSFGGGTYAEHDAIVFVGGDSGTSKYDVSQIKIGRGEFVRTRNCIDVTDSVPSGEAPGNSITVSEVIAICNGFLFKSPGSNNRFQNIEVYVDSGSGGHALVMKGGNAFGWTINNMDADGYSGAAGWEPIHADTAGDVQLFTWDGGIIWPRSAVVPAPVLDAGTGTKGQRYRINNVNNVESTTESVNAVKAAQWISTYNRSSPDGVNIDFSLSASLTPSGSMTLSGVTIAPAQYEITNKQMTVTLKATFTVGGTPSSTISFGIPESKVAAMTKRVSVIVKNGGSFIGTGIAEVINAGTAINCYVDGTASNWSAGAGSIEVEIRFPIQ